MLNVFFFLWISCTSISYFHYKFVTPNFWRYALVFSRFNFQCNENQLTTHNFTFIRRTTTFYTFACQHVLIIK